MNVNAAFNRAVNALDRSDFDLLAADVARIARDEAMPDDRAWRVLAQRIGGAPALRSYVACLRIGALRGAK